MYEVGDVVLTSEGEEALIQEVLSRPAGTFYRVTIRREARVDGHEYTVDLQSTLKPEDVERRIALTGSTLWPELTSPAPDAVLSKIRGSGAHGSGEEERLVQAMVARILWDYWIAEDRFGCFVGVLPPGETGTWLAITIQADLVKVVASQLVGERALPQPALENLATAGFTLDEDPEGTATAEIRVDPDLKASLEAAAALASAAILRVYRPYFPPFEVRGVWSLQNLD